jgi:hypothetical protein
LNEALNEASGCSIDTSSRWFKELGQELNIDFFDRSLIYQNQGLQGTSLFTVKKAVESGAILPNTLIFNTLIQTKADFDAGFILEANQSWLKKYFL